MMTLWDGFQIFIIKSNFVWQLWKHSLLNQTQQDTARAQILHNYFSLLQLMYVCNVMCVWPHFGWTFRTQTWLQSVLTERQRLAFVHRNSRDGQMLDFVNWLHMEANVLLKRDNMRHFDQPEQQLIQQIRGRFKNKGSSLLWLAASVSQGFDPFYKNFLFGFTVKKNRKKEKVLNNYW